MCVSLFFGKGGRRLVVEFEHYLSAGVELEISSAPTSLS